MPCKDAVPLADEAGTGTLQSRTLLSRHVRPPPAAIDMIIHHTDTLHEGIDDGAADKAEPSTFHIL